MAQDDLELIDVKIIFMHGDLEERIYMKQLEGFTQEGQENLVCLLEKFFYRLKLKRSQS